MHDPDENTAMTDATDLVVVGYDGSVQSGAAVDWAAQEADRRGRRLLVTCVSDASRVTDSGLGSDVWPSAELQAAKELADEGALRARKTYPDLETLTAVPYRRPAEVLVEQSHGQALLVVGASGHNALPAALFGSVAFAAISHAACPVVVVRGDSDRQPGPEAPVVLGVDGSDSCRAAIGFAADTAARSGAPLVVTHAWRSIRTGGFAAEYWLRAEPGVDHDSDSEAAARELLHQVRTELARTHPDLVVRTQAVRGHAAAVLADAARDAALVVVGARGRGGFTGLVLGSVGRGLAASAPCPVAVVRPRP